MEQYIKQLIDDIHKATWNLKPPHKIWELSAADPDNELELEDMTYAEKHIYGRKKKISKITGISAESLPPSNKLNSEQKHFWPPSWKNYWSYFILFSTSPRTFLLNYAIRLS